VPGGASGPLDRARRLVAGDRVGIVAPAGPVPGGLLAEGVEVLRGWGLEPVLAPHVLDAHPSGYLAGADLARAADLGAFWCDPSLAAVLCARGGYGTQRMADLLDWDAMARAEPKVFVGFSDITVLHEAFATRLRVATLHGPMPGTPAFLSDPAGREHLRRTLFAPQETQVLRAVPPGEPGAGVAGRDATPGAVPASAPQGCALVPGRATGVTMGGCLSLLASDLGTRSGRPSAAGGIVLLEDTGEEPYRLDRYLTQLLRSGWLDGVAGIAAGSWEGCGPYADVRALLLDRLAPLGVPVLEGLPFGHGTPALTVPLGAAATLDAGAGTLTLHAPALR
jgi:muramoyltetrapeptide carboxypeptidase